MEENIPDNALIVLTPVYDEELAAKNIELAEANRFPGLTHGNLHSVHGTREGEAGYPLAGAALPVEGATQAPEIENQARR